MFFKRYYPKKKQAILFISLILALPCTKALSKPSEDGLANVSIEDLLNTNVTSVSKYAQKVLDSAAAIYVISHEDIRRSGLNSIPELLRLAPGMQVARIDAENWSVGSRGFGGLFSDKLLVLIDGRSVYNPLFSGVWWNTQDTMIEDIDRIEIIRGPGATLWGANAVNGVINIVTKKSSETQSGIAHYGAANADQTLQEGIRYGGTLSNGANYRFYAKTFKHSSSLDTQGNLSLDSWSQNQTGFRFDFDQSENRSVCIQGDIFETDAIVSRYSGGNMLVRYDSGITGNAHSSFQLYYDHTKMLSPEFAGEDRGTVDFQYQHSKLRAANQQIVWGLGYRQTSGDFVNGPIINFSQPSKTDKVFNAFIQNETAIKPKVMKLTLGTKLERNNYTGYEIQPNVRLLWTPSETRTAWAAVSRAVRTPSVADYTAKFQTPKISIPGHMDMVTIMDYNTSLKSEVLTAHELGYRIDFGKGLFLDASAFYNVYKDLQSYEPENPEFSPGPPPYMTMRSVLDNKLSAISKGLELVTDWRVNDRWKLAATCSWIDVSLNRSQSQDPTTAGFESLTPANQIGISSYWTLPGDLEIDALLFRVGKCDSASATGEIVHVPAYTRLDLRVGKPINSDYALSFGVRNALDKRHLESGAIHGASSEVERSIYCTISRTY